MCTLSYVSIESGFLIGFNRDEQFSRKLGVSPKVYTEDKVRFLCPVDSSHGGTWLGVNEFGGAVGLLNYYERESFAGENAGKISRGLLVKDMLKRSSIEAVREALSPLNLSVYKPFRLVVFWLNKVPWQAVWDGRVLSYESVGHLVVSSSFDVSACSVTRSEAYSTLVNDNSVAMDDLYAYHGSHLPEKGALSVCVHRPEVGSLSFTGILLTKTFVEMVYADGPPCCTALENPIRLDFVFD